LTKPLLYAIISTESEVIEMSKKPKKINRRVFKKEGEELQQYLHFMRRGSKVESGKKYNRQKMKRDDKE
jgi:hypothetical protein